MTSPYNILIADDDAQIRTFVTRVVLSLVPQAQLTITADGLEALAALQHARFDLVITDYQMPGADGLQVAAEARRHNAAVRIVMISADQFAAEAAAAAQINFFLAKPFLLEELTATIRSSLSLP